jgi:hypothetical protein
MTFTRWIIATATFAACWCVGAFALLPRMEAKLARAADEALTAQLTLTGRLDRVQVLFEGQTARLSGKVRTVQDQLIVGSTIENLVRAPTMAASAVGNRLNPVTAVRNDIEVAPFPAGWILLTTDGPKARLIGTAATDVEGRDLVHAVVESWSANGGQVEGRLGADLQSHDEAANVTATLSSIPAPPDAGPRVEAHLARIGGRFEQLKLAQSDDALHDHAAQLGVGDSEWSEHLLPLLQDLRRQQTVVATQEKESARVSALPLGHLFVAVRDSRVLLRGAVGSAAIKRAMLDEALEVFTTRRVHDAIRVDAGRRPVADFPRLTSALLPAADAGEAKAFHLGISGQAWQALDWRGAAEAKPWVHPLPAGIEDAFLTDDSKALTNWLQGGADDMPESAPTQPAFVVLALFDKKALLSGQIAEPALQAQLLSAIRKTYSPGIRIDFDSFIVRGDCEPAEDVLHTAKSLPPFGEAPLFAIARPGKTWTLIPVSRDLLEPGGLRRSGLIPDDLPPNLIEQAAADAIEQLRMHLQTP